jgi:general secretion pathway protein M
MWREFDNAFRGSSVGRWFETLQPNERTMVTSLVAFLVIVVLYMAVWRPLNEWSNRADALYQRQIAVLDWMRLHESEAKAAGQRADATRGSGSLLTVVANSAAHTGLQLLRYQPEGSGGVSVVLQNQSFDALIAWIAELEQDDHVTVKQISVDAQAEPGLVNARIILI